MRTTTKLPKGWKSEPGYRGYSRSFGPLKVTVSFRCYEDDHVVNLTVGTARITGCTIPQGTYPTDADLLRAVAADYKTLIRSWAK